MDSRFGAVEREKAPDSRGLAHVGPPGAAEREEFGGEDEAFHVVPPGAVTADLADAQQGNVTRGELLDAGVSRHVITRRANSGELHRVHRGVYVAGHRALAPRALETAALLACGDRALISHRSAAYLWSIVAGRPDDVDVTLVGANRRSRKGIRLHFAVQIDARDVRPMENLRLTAPARTLVDFAADAEDDELESALSEARALKLIKDGHVEAALDRAGKRRGVARMRRLLRLENDSGYTRSRAERGMRRLMRGAGLPQPLCNRRIHGCRVDFVWLEHRLVVEVDGYQFHGHRSAFERDRKNDQVLVAAGYRVIRITWLQLVHEPLRVAAVIAVALSGGRTRGH